MRPETLDDAPRERPLVSLVVPVHDEADCLPELIARIERVMAGTGADWELIFVDDGSRDGSFERIEEAARANPAIRGLAFSRNMGHQAALSCGLRAAAGDAVVTLDGDLQHPPEAIPEMLSLWRQGFQVVNTARRRSERVGLVKRGLARLFYLVHNLLSDVKLIPGGSDFRLLDRRSVDAINSLGEAAKFHRGLVHYIGFRQTVLPFDSPGRWAGRRKYTFRRSLRLAGDGIFSFSTLPLKVPFYLGLALMVPLGLYFLVSIALYLGGEIRFEPGWGSVVAILLATFGVQLLFIGVVGLYLARIFIEVKHRPEYFVWRSVNYPGGAAGSGGGGSSS